MNRDQIQQLKSESTKQLAEAKKLMKKAKYNSTEWRINRDLSLINRAEIDILKQVLNG
jgi:hypothetical protein